MGILKSKPKELGENAYLTDHSTYTKNTQHVNENAQIMYVKNKNYWFEGDNISKVEINP